MKREKMKNKSRVIRNQSNSPPIWQADKRENNYIRAGEGVLTQIPPVNTSPFMARYMKNMSNPTSDDFLDLLTKVVEEKLKLRSELD